MAIIGRPNTGKSTFLNAFLDAKVSIISPKPQTTWRTIKGIYTESRGQIIFLDAPGMHQSEEAVNVAINDRAKRSAQEADVILHFIDSSRNIGEEDELVRIFVGTLLKPVIRVYTKSDVGLFSIPQDAIAISSIKKE